MKNSNKINRNRPQLSKEEIEQHKNFKTVLGNSYKMPKKKPGFSSFKFFTGVLAVGIIAAVVYTEIQHEKKEKDNSKNTSKNFIAPPIKKADVPFEAKKISAETGGVVEFDNGTKITVPANAFTDANGNPVKGNVEIKFRQFDNVVDVFLSGIPMTYDSAGVQYHFETAGMIDVKGFQNNKPVYIAANKKLHVDMLSEEFGGKYNLYKLDTVSKNWSYLGKEKIEEVDLKEVAPCAGTPKAAAPARNRNDEGNRVAMSDSTKEDVNTVAMDNAICELITAKKETQKLVAQKPLEPIQANPKNMNFTIDVDPKEFPEISVYKDVLFEIDEKFAESANKESKELWEEVSLNRETGKDVYKVFFKNKVKKISYDVTPVVEGKNFAAAKEKFASLYTEYRTKLNDRKSEEQKQAKELQVLIRKQKQEINLQKIKWEEEQKQIAVAEKKATDKALEEERIAAIKMNDEIKLAQIKFQQEATKRAQNLAMVTRSFDIEGFGFYNSDCPHMLPVGQMVAATFTDENGKPLNVYDVTLIDRSLRTQFVYHADKHGEFKFNPDADNTIWCITNDGDIAIFRDFKLINKSAKEFQFKMKTIDLDNKNSAEIKAILNNNS